MTAQTIRILDKDILVSNERIDIFQLKFLRNNPRVYACTHGQPGFEDMEVEEQQRAIFQAIRQEPSVTNVLRDLEHHGGLLEPILVRMDTMEVIEGNSRLAAYRVLHKKKPNGQWSEIECSTVSSLTDEQQDAYQNQIHVKGKTKWSAYEKANFAFVRQKNGYSFKDMARIFSESESTLRKRVKVIQRMADNEDKEQSNFSFYDVIERNHDIRNKLNQGQNLADLTERKYLDCKNLHPSQKEALEFRNWLLHTIRNSNGKFTAQEMRKQLPVVLKKPKVLKQLMGGKLKLEEAYNRATVSKATTKVRRATELLQDVSAKEVKGLDNNSFNAFKQDVRKLRRAFDRIAKIMEAGTTG